MSAALGPSHDTLWDMARIALAMFLGAVIGLERELARKAAGLRTHILVATAAASLVVIGDGIVEHYGARFPPGLIRADPLRIVSAIFSGVAFLGAGVIIRAPGGGEEHVEGLTTAASVLVTAAVGIAAGGHRPWLAAAVATMTVVVLRGLEGTKRFVDHLRSRSSQPSQSSLTPLTPPPTSSPTPSSPTK